MTELTPREILDAIRRGLEETERRVGADKPSQPSEAGRQPDGPTANSSQRKSQTER